MTATTFTAASGAEAREWFAVRQLHPHAFLIGEPPHVSSFLIEGDERAVLFDTGLGVADIGVVARSLTDRPISVVNSHFHFDHIGGNDLFASTAIHEAGVDLLLEGVPPEWLSAYLRYTQRMLADLETYEQLDRTYFRLLDDVTRPRPLPPSFEPDAWRIGVKPPDETLRHGDVLDLGGTRLRVLHVPGHSPDGICLLDEASGALFAGDSLVAGSQYVHLPGSDLAVWADALERLDREVGERITVIHPCHFLRSAVAPDLLQRSARAARLVLAGQTTPRPGTDIFGEPTHEHRFGDFSIMTAPPP